MPKHVISCIEVFNFYQEEDLKKTLERGLLSFPMHP